MDNKVLIVEGLGKRYKRYDQNRPRSLMQAALAGFPKKKPIPEFWVLQDVSLTVEPGEALGVLGRNGAGKSTLLQLIGGVGRAEVGKIWVNGQIGALLDMGAGFHGDLTGRENLLVTGLVAGLSKQQVRARFDEIVEFAELSDFIDSPMRTYSSGMRMRLAFSIAIHNNPDLLLIDEHLSVGDIGFKAKCIERIEQLKAGGCGIVLISQSPEQVEDLCDRALLLKAGKVVAYDIPAVVREAYEIQMGQRQQPADKDKENAGILPSSPLKIGRVKVSPYGHLTSGQALSVEVTYLCTQPVAYPIFNLRLIDYEGDLFFTTNTQFLDTPESLEAGTGKVSLQFDRLDLPHGDYFIEVGIHSPDWNTTYDYQGRRHGLAVRSTTKGKGHINPPFQWKMIELSDR